MTIDRRPLLLALAATTLLAAQPAPEAPPAPPASEDAAEDEEEGSRIVRGTPARVGTSPWQIGIFTTKALSPEEIAADRALPNDDRNKRFYASKSAVERDHVCGGVLIDREWALSAAHCFFTKGDKPELRPVEDRRVRLGHVALELATEMKIERVVVHAEYQPDGTNRQNDIALLHLVPDEKTRPAVLARARPAPVIGPRDRPLANGDRLLVTGWGVTAEREVGALRDDRGRPFRGSTLLLEGLVHPVDAKRCRAVRQYRETMSANVLCVASDDTDQDSCQGDSGGPLTREGVLVGLVQGGVGCGLKGVPAIYTRVDRYADWIRLAKAQSPAGRSSRCALTGRGARARLNCLPPQAGR